VKKVISAMVLMLMILASISIVMVPSAKAETDVQIINEDEYYYLEFELASDEQLTFSINVVDGPNIDVFLMNSTEFANYVAGNEFYVFVDGSADDVGSFESRITGEGTYFLVIDNTDAGVAYPPYNGINDPVTFEITYQQDISDEAAGFYGWMFILLIIVIIVIVLVVVLLVLRKKKHPASIVPPPPYQPQPVQPTTKYCNNCGAPLNSDSSFCPKCGAKQL
jgi:hypothetical protein